MLTNEQISKVFTDRVTSLRITLEDQKKTGRTEQAELTQVRLSELELILNRLAKVEEAS